MASYTAGRLSARLVRRQLRGRVNVRSNGSQFHYLLRKEAALSTNWPTIDTDGLAFSGFQTSPSILEAHNFTMPAMSPTMTEGNIASWKVKEGMSIPAHHQWNVAEFPLVR